MIHAMTEDREKFAQDLAYALFVIEPMVLPVYSNNKPLFTLSWHEAILERKGEVSGAWRFLHPCTDIDRSILPEMISQWMADPDDMEIKQDIEFVFLSFAVQDLAQGAFVVEDDVIVFKTDIDAIRFLRLGIEKARGMAREMISSSERKPAKGAN